MRLSWVLAPVTRACSGSPLRSHSTWYLLPAFPRSVGDGPVASPRRLARTLTLSTAARDQSSRSCWASRSSTTRCSCCHTPACCHSRSRRQHVTPEPHPSSWGSSFQLIPLLSTNTIPASAARSGTRGRPVRPRLTRTGRGIRGCTSSHSSSLTNRSRQDRPATDDDDQQCAQPHPGPTRRLLKRCLILLREAPLTRPSDPGQRHCPIGYDTVARVGPGLTFGY